MRCIVFLFFLLSLMVSCINEAEEQRPSTSEVAVGDSLPTFQVTMNDGSELDNGVLRGKASVIVFFHTKCKDCQQELPVLNAFYLAHAGDSLFCMACISRIQGLGEILSYWHSNNLTMPISAQEDRAVFDLFAHSRIPHIYISDVDGIVRYIHDDRNMPSLETLEQELQSMMMD